MTSARFLMLMLAFFLAVNVCSGFEVEPIWKYKTGDSVLSVAITPDGSYVVAGSDDHYVYMFDRNGNLLWRYKTGDTVRSVAITPDGRYVVAGSDDNHVYMLDRNGNLLWKYKTGDDVNSVAITPDGYVVAGSNDHYVYLFKIPIPAIRPSIEVRGAVTCPYCYSQLPSEYLKVCPYCFKDLPWADKIPDDTRIWGVDEPDEPQTAVRDYGTAIKTGRCPNCGYEITDANARFCPYCGYRLR